MPGFPCCIAVSAALATLLSCGRVQDEKYGKKDAGEATPSKSNGPALPYCKGRSARNVASTSGTGSIRKDCAPKLHYFGWIGARIFQVRSLASAPRRRAPPMIRRPPRRSRRSLSAPSRSTFSRPSCRLNVESARSRSLAERFRERRFRAPCWDRGMERARVRTETAWTWALCGTELREFGEQATPQILIPLLQATQYLRGSHESCHQHHCLRHAVPEMCTCI